MATLALQTEVDNETLQYHPMVLKKNQHQLLEKIKEKELIEEMEIINPHPHPPHPSHPPHLVIQVETPTQMIILMMMTMEKIIEGERAAGRHALLDDHLFPEILLPKHEQF